MEKKGRFKRRGGIKRREIKRLLLKKRIHEPIPYSRGDEARREREWYDLGEGKFGF